MKEYQSPEFEIVRIVFNRDVMVYLASVVEIVRIVFNRDVMVYLASVETDIPDIDVEM